MHIIYIFTFFFLLTILYRFSVYATSILFRNKFQVKRDYNLEPTVSVLISCFNEGKAVYKSIKSIYSSNYPREKIEVLAFDDCSKDDTWEWLQKAAQDFPVKIFMNKQNQGKADTLCDAANISTGEILITTDSDTIMEKSAIKELVVCFADPKIGAVGGKIGIYNANESLLCQLQTINYMLVFTLFKPMENITRNVQCLGGALVAVRRQIYLEVLPEVKKNHFLGARIQRGEDRFITQQILLKGHKTFITLKAKCWAGTPVTLWNYMKQQLRWTRSAVGQWFNTIVYWKQYLNTGLVMTLGSFLPSSALLSILLFTVYVILVGNFLQTIAVGTMIACVFTSLYGVLFNILLDKDDPYQRLKNPILVGFLTVVWFTMYIMFIVPWALFTLDDGGWVTRQNGAKGNL